MAATLPGTATRRARRRAPPRRPAQDHRRAGRAGHHQDAGDQAPRRHPLEHPGHGRGRRPVPDGTTPLSAALDVATGRVIGKCYRRHRQREFLKFLNEIDAQVERGPGVEIHIILDNYGTHKTPAVKRWFERHPEYHLHFTPTSGSWLNQVERFFAEITEKRIRRGAFRSVAALEAAILEYLANHNENPRPFVWTANADLILERVK